MIRRGQIWWVDLGEPRGSGPGLRRPALVLQRDEVNASRISTVVVGVLTTNLNLADAPGNVLLSRKVTRLPRDSVLSASQLATLDQRDLLELVSSLPRAEMERVSRGLRWFLALE
ncbi:MAG: type II toxin-antitoxin system PemK/MazF family toxin [Myxococcota bacterium]